MTPKRAFWETFATVCLPSLAFWTGIAFFLRAKFNLPIGEALPLYLVFAILPMPLVFPVYRRYRSGTPRNTKLLSRRASITMAVLFAAVGTMHAWEIRHEKDVWEVAFHAAQASVWLILSIVYAHRGMATHHPEI
ncbi:MAG TPA: hypothetical protein VMT67_04275 [Terriglobales bacterium]|nr:hypothetical protein [Terriglobales bacterium]